LKTFLARILLSEILGAVSIVSLNISLAGCISPVNIGNIPYSGSADLNPTPTPAAASAVTPTPQPSLAPLAMSQRAGKNISIEESQGLAVFIHHWASALLMETIYQPHGGSFDDCISQANKTLSPFPSSASFPQITVARSDSCVTSGSVSLLGSYSAIPTAVNLPVSDSWKSDFFFQADAQTCSDTGTSDLTFSGLLITFGEIYFSQNAACFLWQSHLAAKGNIQATNGEGTLPCEVNLILDSSNTDTSLPGLSYSYQGLVCGYPISFDFNSP